MTNIYTAQQLDEQAKRNSGVTEDLIRISVGTEHIDDIIADFEQSFAKSATKPQTNGTKENKDVTGSTDGDAGIAGST